MRYTVSMSIESFADRGSQDIYNGVDSKAARQNAPKELWDQARDLLDQLEGATALGDMRIPPSNKLEKLKGDRAGQWSVRINGKYRVCFTWEDGRAKNVEVTNHYS